jgi:hypothetical protein
MSLICGFAGLRRNAAREPATSRSPRSSRLLLAVCDDRSGPDYQVAYLAALRVKQVGLVRGDDELYPVPGAQLGQQSGHVRLGGAHGDMQGGGDLGVGQAEALQFEHLAFAVGDSGELTGLGPGAGLAGELCDQAPGDARGR